MLIRLRGVRRALATFCFVAMTVSAALLYAGRFPGDWPGAVLVGAEVGVLATLLLTAGVRRYLQSGEPPLEVRPGLRAGGHGRVSVAIPPGGVGAVSCIACGKRVSVPATAADGRSLPAGTPVRIEALRGRTASVRPDASPRRGG